jgi:hypothetical protein|tara:strand:+ start:620 stop:1036 length:417 start_codon:yes stop_codon:yes gene_type:complete
MIGVNGLDDELAHGVANALRSQIAREHNAAYANQEQLAHSARREINSVEGVGSLKARIDPTSYHYWGKRVGYDCWNDRKFLKEYLRDNPESRVKSVSGKTQVGYGSNKPLGYYDTPVGRVTFRKVYGRNPRVEVDANA